MKQKTIYKKITLIKAEQESLRDNREAGC